MISTCGTLKSALVRQMRLHQPDQALHSHRSIKGAATVGIFDVVGTQHDDDEIKRLMRAEQHGQSHRAITLRLTGWIRKHRRSPVHALFNDTRLATKPGSQGIGPAVFKGWRLNVPASKPQVSESPNARMDFIYQAIRN